MSRAAGTRFREIIGVPDGAIPNGIPAEFTNHALVQNRAFFTLPQTLLTLLVAELGEDSFDPEIQRLERALSQISGDHTQLVGFWRDAPVSYYILRRMPVMEIDDAMIEGLGWGMSAAEANAQHRVADHRSLKYFKVVQGYAGWLMTNPTFIQEHDELFRRFPSKIREMGLPSIATPVANGVARHFRLRRRARSNQFFEQLQAFCLRWRLSGLAAPNLPMPLHPQTPAPAPLMATGPGNSVGALFYLPDTFPVPGREELRNIMEESLRGAESPQHLAGWTKIIRSKNPSKTQISRFGRVFELQHYCRILQERCPNAIRRRQGGLERALAAFMNVSPDTIHRDLLFTRRRLGRELLDRENNLAINSKIVRKPRRPR